MLDHECEHATRAGFGSFVRTDSFQANNPKGHLEKAKLPSPACEPAAARVLLEAMLCDAPRPRPPLGPACSSVDEGDCAWLVQFLGVMREETKEGVMLRGRQSAQVINNLMRGAA